MALISNAAFGLIRAGCLVLLAVTGLPQPRPCA